MRHCGQASDTGGDQMLTSVPSDPFIRLCFPGRRMLFLKLQRQDLHMGDGPVSCLLAGKNGFSGRQSPVCPPPATAPIQETPTTIRNHSIWGLLSPGLPPTTEAPPSLLALTRDFSASLAGSIASQVPCAELEPSSSRKLRAQRTFLPQLPIPRLVAGFPSARVTSSAGRGEEARGVKREEGP